MSNPTQLYLAQVEQVTAPPIDWAALTPLLVVLGAAAGVAAAARALGAA